MRLKSCSLTLALEPEIACFPDFLKTSVRYISFLNHHNYHKPFKEKLP